MTIKPNGSKSSLRHLLRTCIAPLSWRFVGKTNPQSFEFFYNSKQVDELTRLAIKWGTDKGYCSEIKSSNHNYTTFYNMILHQRRLQVQTILECGIGTTDRNIPSNMGKKGIPGASLRMWREYFPIAHIYGCDIDSRILFQEERISTLYVDQLDPESIKAMISQIPNSVDLIFDDGLHTFEAGKNFLDICLPNLAKSGLYFIEDVGLPDARMYQEYLNSRDIPFSFIRCVTPERSTLGDNNIIMISNLK